MPYVKNSKLRGVNRERRKFLDFITKAGFSSAMLKSSPLIMSALSSRYIHAANGGNKRAVFMFLGDGSPPNNWLPKSADEMALSTVPYGASDAPGIKAYDVANYCHFHRCYKKYGNPE